MKTRISILVTCAVAVLGGPAAQVAGAMIPWDTKSGAGEPGRGLLVTKKPQAKAKVAGRFVTFYPGGITFSGYDPQAYVHGGAPAAVAKAIQDAGRKGLQ
jgi:hypothetical protein